MEAKPIMTYFMQSKHGGPIKIGKGDPERRLKDMKTARPDGLVILGVVEGDREREFHDRFSGARISDGGGSEWFENSPELCQFILKTFKLKSATKKTLVDSHERRAIKKTRREIDLIQDFSITEDSADVLTVGDWLISMLDDVLYDFDDECSIEAEGDDNALDYCECKHCTLLRVGIDLDIESSSIIEEIGVNLDSPTIVVSVGPLSSGRRVQEFEYFNEIAHELDRIVCGLVAVVCEKQYWNCWTWEEFEVGRFNESVTTPQRLYAK